MLSWFRTSPPKMARESRIAAGRRVYAVGDIHGRADLLTRLLTMIAEDVKTRPAGETLLVFVGDYIDRGLQSRQVVEILLHDLPPIGSKIFLSGNHEEVMLKFLDGNLAIAPSWLQFGGRETLLSYGIKAGFVFKDESALETLRHEFAAALPSEHLAFFRALGLIHSVDDYAFVHAGVRAQVPFDAQDRRDLLWIRDDFLSSREDFGKIIVHGHSINKEPDIHPNRIGIDTGAYATSRLTCLVLEGAERHFLST